MAIHFYNTLTRKKEAFKEIEPGKVRFYSCGPTVHNFAHIGNFRTFLVFDLIKRYLTYRGFSVQHIMNITDVEDKIIRGVREGEESLESLTGRYSEAFLEDMEALNIMPADHYPKATEHIPEMVEMVQSLIEDGYAYVRDRSVYFSIDRFPKYGELARLDVEGMKVGASGVDADEYDKENVRDFALWKGYHEDDGDVFWETDLGKGRPGWHLECSCMSIKYLGETIDIHAGGEDLIFPHHQNEIAQSEAYTGKEFANYWLHSAFMNINNQKMSKSLGNFLTLRDIVNSPDDARAFRYLVVSSHYRTSFSYSDDVLEGAKSTLRHLSNFRTRLENVDASDEGTDVGSIVDAARQEFIDHMDDDLNSPRAMASIFGLVDQVEGLLSKEELGRSGADLVEGLLQEVDQVLGVFYVLPEDDAEQNLDEDLQAKIDEREEARASKNWQRADEIRDELLELGYVLEDTADGTVWKRA